ncbi:Gamma-aminobutyric acid receptor subunit beta-like [Nymphon striatum]|nr:Gamma-aminobutyric acid receptor subunit beta-like [Nymphon striatum]
MLDCVRVKAAGGESQWFETLLPLGEGQQTTIYVFPNRADPTCLICSDNIGWKEQCRPLYVGMALKVASFDSISEVNMDYTITLNLQQYWTDGRLAFSNESSELTLSGDFAEKIWVPDTFFANDKNSFLHDVTEKNKMVKLSSDGSIAYSMRFTTTLACMMDLHNYPLDLQECTVEIESYGYTVNDVVMYWITVPIDGVKEIKLPQFSIVNHNTKDRSEVLATVLEGLKKEEITNRKELDEGRATNIPYIKSELINGLISEADYVTVRLTTHFSVAGHKCDFLGIYEMFSLHYFDFKKC